MTSADPRAGNLGYWCSASAARFPDKVARIDLSRDPARETTYAELERRLDRVAATLTGLGFKSGDRLAMSIGNCIEFVEILFGAMRAGIVPVPLNTKLGPETLRYVIEDSGCAGAAVELAANSHVVSIVDSLGLDVRLLLDSAAAGWLRYEDALAESRADFEPSPLGDDHLAFLPYTSGSTGKPTDARRTMLVDRLPAQILADAGGESRSCRRAAVP
jgi:long-chain acyl-CoA synthetase